MQQRELRIYENCFFLLCEIILCLTDKHGCICHTNDTARTETFPETTHHFSHPSPAWPVETVRDSQYTFSFCFSNKEPDFSSEHLNSNLGLKKQQKQVRKTHFHFPVCVTHILCLYFYIFMRTVPAVMSSPAPTQSLTLTTTHAEIWLLQAFVVRICRIIFISWLNA